MVKKYLKAYHFLDLGTQEYVKAKSILDKLFAINLVVVSMILAVDVLVNKNSANLMIFNQNSRILNPNFDLNIFKERVVQISSFEQQLPNKDHSYSLSQSFENAVEFLSKVLQDKNPISMILEFNFKEFLNEGFKFLSTCQKISKNSQ